MRWPGEGRRTSAKRRVAIRESGEMAANHSRGVLVAFHGRRRLAGLGTRRDQHSLNRVGAVAVPDPVEHATTFEAPAATHDRHRAVRAFSND
jgi:hypothetical protein